MSSMDNNGDKEGGDDIELSRVIIHMDDNHKPQYRSPSIIAENSNNNINTNNNNNNNNNKNNKTTAAVVSSEKEEEGELLLTTNEGAADYQLSIPSLARKYNTNIVTDNIKLSAGLTSMEAEKRLERDGPNELTPPAEQSELIRLLTKFSDPFFIFLSIASLFALIAYLADRHSPTADINWQISIVLISAVIISALFAYWQEGKASSAMKSFKRLMPSNATVIRDGIQKKIPAKELVVGDVVLLSTGDRTPADIRVIYASEAKQDKAALTGESLPVVVTYNPDSRADKLEEASNVCFNSCPILEGQVIGVVIAIGDGTVIGRIANLASQTSNQETPVQIEVKTFVKKLSLLAFILAIIFFIIAMARGKTFLFAFINVFVVIMISVIPEGLPLTVMSCLAVTAKKMSEKNIFVKELRSVETLGSATVIASDKTGTLTQNIMTVMQIWCDLMPMNAQQIMHDTPLPIFEANTTLAMPPNNTDNNTDNNNIGERKRIERAGTGINSGVSAYGVGGISSIGMNLLELIMAVCNRGKYDNEHPLSDDEATLLLQKLLAQQLTQLSNPHIIIDKLKSANPILYQLINQSIDPNKTLRSALSYQIMNNDYNNNNVNKKRTIIADASEKALLEFIISRGQSVELYRYYNPIVYEVPFNSRNKFALTIIKSNKKIGQSQNRRLLMKGAPEIILKHCSYYVARDEVLSIDSAFISRFNNAYEYFGGQGMRVLGYAYCELDETLYPPSYDSRYNFEEKNFPLTGLIFVGLTALADPPKHGVDKAIVSCKTAGIKVMMVTGDHSLTAESIARNIGLIDRNSITRKQAASTKGCSEIDVPLDDYQAVVVEGSDLLHYQQSDWDRLLIKSEIVFARTTPIQKLQIVEQLQKKGEIVAVTGDGVNDSPALKQANIGLAMGIGGSDVARDAADVIIMDDNFASIVEGVRFGRAIFDNLTKVVCYTVTHLVPETIPTLLYIAFDFPAALPTLAIIAIDLGSEMPSAISFAWEPPEGDIMNTPPRNPKISHLFTIKTLIYTICIAGALETLVCYLGWLLVYDYYGISSNQLIWSNSNHWSIGGDTLIINNNLSYSDTEQVDISLKAGGCYWYLLVAGQFMHLFMTKTRRSSIFTVGIFNNAIMILAALCSILLAMLFIWTPIMNAVLVGLPFPGKYWSIALLIWGLLFIMAEGRKFIGRKYPNSWFHRYINF